VQVHNLPFGVISEGLAWQLGDFIGHFIPYDVALITRGKQRYMRFRTKIDVRLAVKHKKKLALGQGVSSWKEVSIGSRRMVRRFQEGINSHGIDMDDQNNRGKEGGVIIQGEEQCKWLIIVFCAVWHYRNKVYHEGLNEVKCNFDAAFNRCMFSSVSGIIFRNNEGYILATCTYSNSFVADATTTEVRDCLQAATVVEELGFRRLVVERDFLTIIKKARSLEEARSNISIKVVLVNQPPKAK
ncbi:hypothetical protein Godav_020055, partial [Gossypium davidsonii]|nr:hypothetical protein [Gossypium davidsonii]